MCYALVLREPNLRPFYHGIIALPLRHRRDLVNHVIGGDVKLVKVVARAPIQIPTRSFNFN